MTSIAEFAADFAAERLRETEAIAAAQQRQLDRWMAVPAYERKRQACEALTERLHAKAEQAQARADALAARPYRGMVALHLLPACYSPTAPADWIGTHGAVLLQVADA